MDPKLWDDQNNAKAVLQNLSSLKSELDEIKDVSETLEILNEVQDEEELAKLARIIAKLELKSYLSGPYDNKNTIITIHAGQGGTEAMDWTAMLFRMYIRYCERKSLSTETIDSTSGEKKLVLKVSHLKSKVDTHMAT